MEDYQKVASLIRKASFVLVMAGAGMSAESGLKTYEEINKETLGKGLEYADYCDPDMLKDDPVEFWKFWGASANDYDRAQPHLGYEILRSWQQSKEQALSEEMCNHFSKYFEDHYEEYDQGMDVPTNFFVYTSNVDGLFRKSGLPPHSILEIHGNASLLQCAKGVDCQGDHPDVWPLAFPMDTAAKESLPRCPTCKRISRPYVLMFNDEEWLGLEGRGTTSFDMYDVWEEGVEEYMANHEDASIVIVEIGCGDRVPVVKMESETVLGDITNIVTKDGSCEVPDLASRVALVRINVKRSSFLDYHEEWSNGNSHVDPSTVICLEGSCSEVLHKIDECLE